MRAQGKNPLKIIHGLLTLYFRSHCGLKPGCDSRRLFAKAMFAKPTLVLVKKHIMKPMAKITEKRRSRHHNCQLQPNYYNTTIVHDAKEVCGTNIVHENLCKTQRVCEARKYPRHQHWSRNQNNSRLITFVKQVESPKL